MACFGCYFVADRVRHELHGDSPAHAARLHVLQLVLSHLLVDGLVLHSVRGDAGALLENVQNDSREGATVGAAQTADLAKRAERRHFSERRQGFERSRQKCGTCLRDINKLVVPGTRTCT